jgi:hypothetical protein
MMKTKLFTLCCAVLTLIMAVSCGKLDVVGKDSARAFGEMLDTLPSSDDGNDWRIAALDGGASFVWNGERAAVIVDTEPFAKAGADISQFTNVSDGQLLIELNFQSAGREKTNPLADYQRIVDTARSRIGYHTALDHYNIDLGDGNMFEWAKNMSTNDKDIVFVLNPAPFIAAGVDPNKIDGWVFTKVPSMDANGKAIEVDKILKAFNLK